jgi:hypothetical protein
LLQVHIALEHCIKRYLTKQEAVATLQRLGVEALVAALGELISPWSTYGLITTCMGPAG